MKSNVINLSELVSTSQQMMKQLQKEFFELENHELHLILQMCEYQLDTALHLLRNTKKHKLRILMKEMLNDPQAFFKLLKGEANKTTFLNQKSQQDDKFSLQSMDHLSNSNQQDSHIKESPNKQFQMVDSDQLKQQEEEIVIKEELKYIDVQKSKKILFPEEEQSDEQTICQVKVFDHLPENTIVLIMDFLDPKSLALSLGATCQSYNKLSKLPCIYKQYCVNLLTNVSKLPDLKNSPFLKVRNYIFQNPLDFSPEIRLQACFELQKLIWSNNPPQSYRTSTTYYKQFLNYYNMFLYAPRLHYSGVYKIREQYYKIGEQNIKYEGVKKWIVTYYRYIRFLPDGRFRYCLSNNQIQKENLVNIFKDYPIQYQLTNPPRNIFFSPPDGSRLDSMDETLLNHYYSHDYSQTAPQSLPPSQSGGHSMSNHGNPYSIYQELKQGDQQVFEGQYIQKEDEVLLKLPRQSSIFEYRLKIMGSSQGAHNILILQNYNMIYLDTQYTYQLYQEEKSSLQYFQYIPLPDLRKDLQDPKIRNTTF